MLDQQLFEIMYELVDIDEVIETKEYSNMVDISVSGDKTFLLANGIVSHNSAQASVSKVIGRQGNGFFAMFGVPPNAYDSDLSKLVKSDKIIDLRNILNLKLSQTEQTEINFKNIIITSDFDLPGHFIAGQLLGLFYRFGKNLFEEQRIKRFVTPLLTAKDSKGNMVGWFYNFEDYQEFERKNKAKKYHYDFRKGMGSWDQDELEYVISKDGLENMLEVFNIDDIANESIDSWLNGKRADKRKEMLEGYEFNIMNT